MLAQYKVFCEIDDAVLEKYFSCHLTVSCVKLLSTLLCNLKIVPYTSTIPAEHSLSLLVRYKQYFNRNELKLKIIIFIEIKACDRPAIY
jgi:hypothetical protein